MVSTETERGKRLSYQSMLRVLGSRLDEGSAHQISVTEMADGYNVRYQQDPDSAESVQAFYSHQGLLSMEADMKRRKGHSVGSPQGKYQDILRALGYELDQVGAHNIVFDEMKDGFLVTYSFLDASDRRTLQKRAAIFGPKGNLLEDAYARRKPRKRGLMKILERS